MKQFSKYFFLILCICVANVQLSAQVPILDSVERKAGIYASFEEFKNNSPSSSFDYPLITVRVKVLKERLEYFHVAIGKKEAKTKGQIFGFSDGINAYVCGESMCKLKHKTDYYKIESYGRYCLLRKYSVSHSFAPNGAMQSFYYITDHALDINTGEIFHVTKSILASIIKNDTELFNEYKEEFPKKRVLGEYLRRYAERHPDEIVN